jgi:Protein of unknown function (DUF2752)
MTKSLRIAGLLTGVIVAAIGLVLLRLFDPATSDVFPPCPLHYLTGLYCPGCGSLRAIHALLHGNMTVAWAMNPLTVVLLPFIAYGMLSELVVIFRGRGLPQPMLPASAIRALCTVIVLFGVVRNFPLHPFSLLAPGAMLRW